MDPVTIAAAIVAALGAGALKGVGSVGENALTDAYGALKEKIKARFGADSDLAQAVEAVEKKPDREGPKMNLQEELAAAGAEKDPEIVQAVQQLQDQIKARPGGEQHLMSIVGSYNAMADRGSHAEVHVDHPKP